MNTAANRYHWISSRPLELTLKILRTIALPALISVVAKISHIVNLPTPVLILSISRDRDSRAVMLSPSEKFLSLGASAAGAFAHRA